MPTPTPTKPEGKPIGLTILDEVEDMKREIQVLRTFAETLAVPMEGERESFMSAVLTLLNLIVAGTEQTHASLRALHQAMTEPGFTAALRAAMNDD